MPSVVPADVDDIQRHACAVCDQLFVLPVLQHGESAFCPRCAHHVTTRHEHGIEYALAFAVSGLTLLLCATAYPFLGFATAGQVASMTLLDTATSLFEFQQPLLGSIVFVLVLAGPATLLSLLTLLLYLLHYRRWYSWLPELARFVRVLRSWNMVEVFLIGVLVSVAKISSMASVQLGFAFWAFIGFTLCTVVSVSTIDTVQMWRTIRELAR